MNAGGLSRAWALVGVLILAGCGGGGGDGDHGNTAGASNTTDTTTPTPDPTPGPTPTPGPGPAPITPPPVVDTGCQGTGATCPLKLTPSAIQDQFEHGSSATVEVEFTTKLTSQPQAARVTDPAGVFSSVIEQSWFSATSGVARLTSDSAKAPGHYASTIQIELCSDAACAQQIAGSPVLLPYDVIVQTVTPNLTPLTRVTTDWVGLQGNAAHTGAVALTLDATRFSHRWRWTPPANTSIVNASPVVTAGGMAFFSTNFGRNGSTDGRGNWLVALSEATGEQAWVHDLRFSSGTIPPAVHEGVVYAGSKASGGGWDFYTGRALADGQERWSGTVPTQWRYPQAPVFAGGHLLQFGGYNNGGVIGLSLGDRKLDWFTDIWAEAAYPGAVTTDGQLAYAMAHDNTLAGEDYLAIVDVLTGELKQQLRPSWAVGTHPFGTSAYGAAKPIPVLVGPNRILLAHAFEQEPVGAQYHLELIDTARGSDVWHLDLPFATYWNCLYADDCNLAPVVADGVFYVLNPGSRALEARSLSDGSKLWSWAPPGGDRSPIFGYGHPSIVAAGNMVFVSTARFVYAVNMATHAAEWRRLTDGRLAISANGVLYVSRRDGRVDAVNLR